MKLRIMCHLFGCHDKDNFPYVLVCDRCGCVEDIGAFTEDFIYQGWIPWFCDSLHAAGLRLRKPKCPTCGKHIGRLRILWRHIVNSDTKWHCNQECLDNDIPF